MVLSTTPSTDDIAPPRSGYRANLEALGRAQKTSGGTPAYSRLVNRPVARRVAAAAHVAGLSPNAATLLSAGLSATGLTLLMVGEPSVPLGCAVALLLASGYVMDSVDGQLARLRGGGSAAGEWLDHTVDCVKTCVFHLAVLVSFLRFPPVESDAALIVPMAFLVVDVTCFFGFILLPLLRRVNDDGRGAPASSPEENPLRMWLLLPSDYGLFCWIFVLLAWSQVFFIAYSLLFAVNAVFIGLACAKWWRELRSLDLQEA
ncbi:MAG: CDP-alcohol phosphatidyltransferase family protein [Actinomycetota bacterium]|nr:CDP-alcohol phosphatidyltransferase family protein [Actinomycetota bacterium]